MTVDVQKKANELSEKFSCKVTPIVFHDEEKDEDVIGYIKEPNRMTKLRVMDKAINSPITAASELFDSIVITEESDPRFFSDDKYYIGGTMEAFKTVEIAVNTFKKK